MTDRIPHLDTHGNEEIMVHRVESPCTHFIFAHFAHLKFDGDHSYKYVFSLQTKMHINIITASASQHMSLPTIRFFAGEGGRMAVPLLSTA